MTSPRRFITGFGSSLSSLDAASDCATDVSLKAFHVLFVIVSTVFCLGFGVWEIVDYRKRQDGTSLILGVASLMGGVALIIYGRWFLRKLKKQSYL